MDHELGRCQFERVRGADGGAKTAQYASIAVDPNHRRHPPRATGSRGTRYLAEGGNRSLTRPEEAFRDGGLDPARRNR